MPPDDPRRCEETVPGRPLRSPSVSNVLARQNAESIAQKLFQLRITSASVVHAGRLEQPPDIANHPRSAPYVCWRRGSPRSALPRMGTTIYDCTELAEWAA